MQSNEPLTNCNICFSGKRKLTVLSFLTRRHNMKLNSDTSHHPLLFAPINVKPQGGWHAQGNLPGNFEGGNNQFPNLWACNACQISPWSTVSLENISQNPYPGGSPLCQIPLGSMPPTLWLNIDYVHNVPTRDQLLKQLI